MSKKLTKTIILIVFVVFLGIKKVNAAPSTYKVCSYQDANGKTISVVIDTSFSITAQTSKNETIPEAGLNWSSNTASSDYKGAFGNSTPFYGYDYFESHGNSCPPNIMRVQFTSTVGIYFFDESSRDAVLKGAKEDKHLWTFDTSDYSLSAVYYGDGFDDEQYGDEFADKFNSIQCSCEQGENQKKMSLDFEVDGVASEPRLTIKSSVFLDGNEPENILNWASSYNGYNYYSAFRGDYGDDQKGKCPKYAIVYHPSVFATELYVGNDAVLSKLQTDHGDSIYYANCSVSATSSRDTVPEETTGALDEDPQAATVNSDIGALADGTKTYSCGAGYMTGIPGSIIRLVRIVYIIIQIIVPIAIVILGTIDLLKAVSSQKEDEIKKSQSLFFKRLIGAVLVFFVFAIVKFIISAVSKGSSTTIIPCINCFLTGKQNCVEE